MKGALKKNMTTKIRLPLLFCPPLPPLKKNYLSCMTSLLDSHTTTDDKLEMLSGVQTEIGIPHDKCRAIHND